MRQVFTVTGAIAWLSFAIVVCLVLHSIYLEWLERKARDREQLERETVNHLARFTGALRVINLAEYRARKANAPATVQASREASEGTRPGAEFITPMGAPRNA